MPGTIAFGSLLNMGAVWPWAGYALALHVLAFRQTGETRRNKNSNVTRVPLSTPVALWPDRLYWPHATAKCKPAKDMAATSHSRLK